MSSSLKGKGAIVTGGARGIGYSIAEELITNGAKVVICSRTKTELQKALLKLNEKKNSAFGITCDVSKFNDCKKLIKFAQKKIKKINILVNNAGIYGPIGLLEKTDLDFWRETMEINIMGMVYLSNLVITIMKKKGGKIINLCGAGVGGYAKPRISAYFTSKIAVAGFTEILAEEVRDYNIQVNSISPGAVNTYLHEYLLKQGPEKAGREFYEESLRQKKMGGTPPKLAAKLVVFLSSGESNHISGRLLSAKWDSPEKLKDKGLNRNLFKLRRIDGQLYYEK